MSKFTIHDPAWSKTIEQEYEEYMMQCWDSIDGDIDEETEPFTTLSGEPFCGCATCDTRETLFFYTPRLIEAYKAGQVTLEE